jgi:hypothetical protein
MMLTTHSNLLPRLRMNGAIPPTLPYAFMACIQTLTFTFTEYSVHVLPVMLLYQMININWTSNNIMGYWELQMCFT